MIQGTIVDLDMRQSYLTNTSRKNYEIKIPSSEAYNLNVQKTSSESKPLDE